ncbi:hypothetical protein EV384_3813 [Micromonospora kangleipakensis]|uniref:Uncharacterized protein n=1 Tax=Micromonospora kangleipakensis TaxID=1077942 RepID=A0A4Q8BD93_9ACTN|nr:hypothetical protein [Micromonospora kangleipakensis]RZU75281.1 hypothetical protein EV384_3813 [Micromonospora kangleipakensis]
MVTWIVLAVVLFALVVLALAVRPVLARLPRLRRAAVALQGRQAEAEALQARAATAQERVALIKAKRGK